MTLPVQPPVFSAPPDEYDREYMKNTLKQIELFAQRVNAQGPLQATKINLSQLPTSATGLRTGDLWNDAGVVKIV